MAKGGKKPKGRPKKVMNLVSQTQSNYTPPRIEDGESSYAAETKESEQFLANFDGTIESVKQRIELEIHDSELKQHEELLNEEKKEIEAQNIEEGELPLMRKCGTPLGYVAPTIKQGKPIAKLCVTEIENEATKWKTAVILYVIGEAPSITYLKNYIQK